MDNIAGYLENHYLFNIKNAGQLIKIDNVERVERRGFGEIL